MFTDDNITRRTRCACWTTKATDKHSEYVILIAFPRQQWLHERASMLRYTYIVLFASLYPVRGVVTTTLNNMPTQAQIHNLTLGGRWSAPCSGNFTPGEDPVSTVEEA
jgi:hypothetical protein